MESNADDCRLSNDDFDYTYGELYYDLCNDGIDTFEDCNLSSDDFQDLLAPATENWNNFSSKDHPAVVTMDHSKTVQWMLAQDEIHHLKKSICQLLGKGIDEKKFNRMKLYYLSLDLTVHLADT